jgi:peptidyl-prolyl cis-trans isomerase C
MKKYFFVFCVVALAGCGREESADNRLIHLPPGGPIAETVNGTPVPQSLLETVARQHNWKLDQPAQRGQALRVLTDLILINQEAQRQNYFAEPQLQADAEFARLKAQADAAIGEFEKHSTVSDAMLKAEYDAQTARTGKSAYDFTQLLFATEDEALKAEADVLAGKPFQQVYDAWRSKAKQGRAFTRVRLDQVPAELAKVISGMQNGETTKIPVKTQFGWHVVHLDIVNPYTPPEFDQVKEGIRRNLQMSINRDRLDKLRQEAKIEYPEGMAPPAASSSTAHPSAAAGAAVPTTGAAAAPGVIAQPAPAVPVTNPPEPTAEKKD